MLSAAHDIIGRFNGVREVQNAFWLTFYDFILIFQHESTDSVPAKNETSHIERQCNLMSTGAILLADIVPSLVIKMLIPFLPLFIK